MQAWASFCHSKGDIAYLHDLGSSELLSTLDSINSSFNKIESLRKKLEHLEMKCERSSRIVSDFEASFFYCADNTNSSSK